MPCGHKEIGQNEFIERELVEEWRLIFYSACLQSSKLLKDTKF